MRKTDQTPHEKRRGWLRHGNPPGDFSKARRCGTRTRRGTLCQCPAMRNRRRCKLHGGLSTGPKTAEGIERIRRTSTTHGQRTKAARAEREYFRALTKEWLEPTAALQETPTSTSVTKTREDLEAEVEDTLRRVCGGRGHSTRSTSIVKMTAEIRAEHGR